MDGRTLSERRRIMNDACEALKHIIASPQTRKKQNMYCITNVNRTLCAVHKYVCVFKMFNTVSEHDDTQGE